MKLFYYYIRQFTGNYHIRFKLIICELSFTASFFKTTYLKYVQKNNLFI